MYTAIFLILANRFALVWGLTRSSELCHKIKNAPF